MVSARVPSQPKSAVGAIQSKPPRHPTFSKRPRVPYKLRNANGTAPTPLADQASCETLTAHPTTPCRPGKLRSSGENSGHCKGPMGVRSCGICARPLPTQERRRCDTNHQTIKPSNHQTIKPPNHHPFPSAPLNLRPRKKLSFSNQKTEFFKQIVNFVLTLGLYACQLNLRYWTYPVLMRKINHFIAYFYEKVFNPDSAFVLSFINGR